MGWASNHINPLQREQSRAEKNMTNGLSIALSLFLGFYVVCGMAFYWVCSNLLSIVVQVLCNVIVKPRDYIDYEDLNAARDEFNAIEEATKGDRKWYQPDPLARRAKADYKRFFKVDGKHLVFYSESSGFYKYFRGAIEWLLNNSDVRIHYLTSDPNDQVFDIAKREPRLHPVLPRPEASHHPHDEDGCRRRGDLRLARSTCTTSSAPTSARTSSTSTCATT